MNSSKLKTLFSVASAVAVLLVGGVGHAGTITISATGLSSSPIFVTSSLASLTVGTELNIGTFASSSGLDSKIAAYKAGVTGTGATTAAAQADADAKKTALYNDTVNWLSSSANFTSIAAVAGTITQTGTTASGKVLFNSSTSRTVNGVANTYAGANGTMDVTYANFSPGAGARLWAWFATGSEIAIVTDSTWLVPSNNTAGLTVGTAQIASSGTGDATELLLAKYTDYASGSDLISSLGITQTLNVVIPEPSTGLLFASGFALLLLRKRRISLGKSNLGTILGGILALAGSAGISQTVSTPVVGFNKLTFPAGNSAHTAAFIKSNVFQGTASSKTANSLTASAASFGSLAPSGGLPTHYVKITSGPMQGYVMDILSNTATTVTVDGDLSTAGSTPSFVIRPHVKASDLFAGNTDLSAGSDTLTLFNENGSSTVLLWVGTDSPTGWIDPVTEAVVDGVVYPGQGFVLTALAAGTFKFQGTVETVPTVVPLYAGAVNLVSTANPSSGSKSLQSIGLGLNMAPGSDTVEFWSNSGSLASSGVYLWAGGADGFIDAVTEASAANNVANSEVMNVTVLQNTTWKTDAPLVTP